MGRVLTGRAVRLAKGTAVWVGSLLSTLVIGCSTTSNPIGQIATTQEKDSPAAPGVARLDGANAAASSQTSEGFVHDQLFPAPPEATGFAGSSLRQNRTSVADDPAHPLYLETVSGEAPRTRAVEFGFTGSYLYGSASGSVQIPVGGKGSTTSASRPEFKEIGIDTASIPDGELTVGFAPHQEVFVGAQIIRLSGSDTLQKSLVTHGVHFPAGTHVSSDVQLDWYRVGYRIGFPIIEAENGQPELMLTPSVDAVFWDFSYDLTAHGIPKADRAFTKIGAQIGGAIAWRPGGGPFVLEAGAASFPHISSWPQISVEYILARYRFLSWRSADFTVHLGVQWEQQDFKDSQATSNHVKADFSPMLNAGLGIRF